MTKLQQDILNWVKVKSVCVYNRLNKDFSKRQMGVYELSYYFIELIRTFTCDTTKYIQTLVNNSTDGVPSWFETFKAHIGPLCVKNELRFVSTFRGR